MRHKLTDHYMSAMYRCFPKKKLLKLTVLVLVVYVTVIVFLYLRLNLPRTRPFALAQIPMNPWRLRELMQSDALFEGETTSGPFVNLTFGSKSVRSPLSDIYLADEELLSFYHLPNRRLQTLYTEVTSANRDTGYPLAPDFTFHIRYAGDQLVLYEDYGPGCIYRFYLFPILPAMTDALYKMKAESLRHLAVRYEIDGRSETYRLDHFMAGDSWPFIFPFNTRHPTAASGMGAYIPICYQKSMRITYVHNETLIGDVFQMTVDCTLNDHLCPYHLYSAVSRYKFPYGTKVEGFRDISGVDTDYQERGRVLAYLLKTPEYSGPGSCNLQCVEVKACPGCKRTLLDLQTPGVISHMKMRVFDTASGALLSNWTNLLITATFDGAEEPQIDGVPLGSLFGATASLNDLAGAAAGKMSRYCSYKDKDRALPSNAVTGYFSFPMPFWTNVKVTVEGTRYMERPLLVCHDIGVVDNHYDAHRAGYLHARKSYYTDDVSGWREILRVDDAWGHVVALFMEIDNLRAKRNVALNERWTALQSDMVLFLDGSRAASMLGTGVEDYFSYSHGFHMAENTSYAFVGVYHASPHQREPLTWHCYRQHILDPIPFQRSIHFLMDGTDQVAHRKPVPPISYDDHVRRKLRGLTAMSHMALYYARTAVGMRVSDSFRLGDEASERGHDFKILKLKSPSTGEIFSVDNLRYLGASNTDETFNRTGRVFTKGDSFQFSLRLSGGFNQGVVLRRDFHAIPLLDWNFKADVTVNGVELGTWFIPMGTLSRTYSLLQDDFLIPQHLTSDRSDAVVKIDVDSTWRDVEYAALEVW